MNPPPTSASQIRKSLAAALAAAWLLIAALTAALALDAPMAARVIIALLVLGAAAGSFFLLRPVLEKLRALDSMERALYADGPSQRPVEAPQRGGKVFQYLSRMVHEGNTLLASILGYGSLIADASLRPADANLEEYGQIVVEQARCMADLLQDFTLAARIEDGQYQPVLRPVRLRALLQTLVDDLAEQSGREILLTWAPVREDPARENAVREDAVREDAARENAADEVIVRADALSFETALRKLVENAIQFSPPSSPVRVSVKTCAPNRQVAIRVQDQGVGIPAAELERLFQPFARGRQESARPAPGYGLGLFIAAAITRAHHGEIGAQSAPGEGAAFTITLPLEEFDD